MPHTSLINVGFFLWQSTSDGQFLMHNVSYLLCRRCNDLGSARQAPVTCWMVPDFNRRFLDVVRNTGTFWGYFSYLVVLMNWLIPVIARPKVWVCGRWLDGIAGSNPAWGHGCLSVVSIVCCQVEVSASAWSLAQRQWRNQEFCAEGGVHQIQLRTEDREDGDLGAVGP